jgi:hypothetical protein
MRLRRLASARVFQKVVLYNNIAPELNAIIDSISRPDEGPKTPMIDPRKVAPASI